MSKAFQCDDCGQYYDGDPSIITLNLSNSVREPSWDLCDNCLERIQGVFNS